MSFSDVQVTVQICLKCKRLRDNTCPFKPYERPKIVKCTAYVNKNSARQRRRWAKFE